MITVPDIDTERKKGITCVVATNKADPDNDINDMKLWNQLKRLRDMSCRIITLRLNTGASLSTIDEKAWFFHSFFPYTSSFCSPLLFHTFLVSVLKLLWISLVLSISALSSLYPQKDIP